MQHKDEGKAHFQRHEMKEALSSYLTALAICNVASERQVLLSNICACRLSLGQTEQAVEDAKACVAMNPSWPKAHVRLASAYVALGGHSNDACQALQRALALDPTHAVARDMLRSELRQRDQPARAPQHDAASGAEYEDATDMGGIDESLTWSERLHMAWTRVVSWYHAQPEDIRALLKVLLVIVLLYVGMGGRFGLEHIGGSKTTMRGNYERGNAYDRYRNRQAYEHRATTTTTRQGGYYSSGNYDDYTRSSSPSYSSGYPNFFDGSFFSLMALATLGYGMYRNGINPLPILFMANRWNRGPFMMGGMYGGFPRYPYANRGYGRPRNGWY